MATFEIIDIIRLFRVPYLNGIPGTFATSLTDRRPALPPLPYSSTNRSSALSSLLAATSRSSLPRLCWLGVCLRSGGCAARDAEENRSCCPSRGRYLANSSDAILSSPAASVRLAFFD
jgi:hypothetical protein